MTEQQTAISANLAETFAKMELDWLPAMSFNVQKLVSLAQSQWSSSADLAKVILQDYSLACKLLQVVNSAPDAQGQSCNSIAQAVNILGFDAIRDLALSLPRFETYIKAGGDKEGICKLWGRAFLSATLAQHLALTKQFNVSSEETFLCTLFHNLGKSVICIYQPENYAEIEKWVDAEQPQNEVCRASLGGVTYQDVGAQVARRWRLSERVVGAMGKGPKAPSGQYDSERVLQNLANFANMLVDGVGNGSDLGPLLQKYEKRLAVQAEELVPLLVKCADIAELLSEAVRYGLAKQKMRGRIRSLEINANHGLLNSDPPAEQAVRVRFIRSCGEEQEGIPATPEVLTTDAETPVPTFLREINEILRGPFEINKVFFKLLEAIYRLLGFDRVILALVKMPPAKQTLHGGFGFGDIDPEGPTLLEKILAQPTPTALSNALTQGRDMMIRADKVNALPEELHYMVRDRTVYLFPLTINQQGLGLIYLDRKAARPLLDQGTIKNVRLLRDCAVKAIEKIYA